MPSPSLLLEIRDLHVGFRIFEGHLRVLRGVTLWVNEGERVGLVGETGCGKTTTVKSVLRVLPIPPATVTGGEILYRHAGSIDPLEVKKVIVGYLGRTYF